MGSKRYSTHLILCPVRSGRVEKHLNSERVYHLPTHPPSSKPGSKQRTYTPLSRGWEGGRFTFLRGRWQKKVFGAGRLGVEQKESDGAVEGEGMHGRCSAIESMAGRLFKKNLDGKVEGGG